MEKNNSKQTAAAKNAGGSKPAAWRQPIGLWNQSLNSWRTNNTL